MTKPPTIRTLARESLTDDMPRVPRAPDCLSRLFAVGGDTADHGDVVTVTVTWAPTELMMARTDRAYVNVGFWWAAETAAGFTTAPRLADLSWQNRVRVHGQSRARHMHTAPGWTMTKQISVPAGDQWRATAGIDVRMDRTPNRLPAARKWPLLRAWGKIEMVIG